MSQHKRRAVKQRAAALHASVARFTGLRPAQALALPASFTLLLVALGALSSARQDSAHLWSFWGTGAGLLVWSVVLFAAALRHGRSFALDVILRKQHYLQACAQLAVFLYWGWYWREVYNAVYLIAAQVVFAYAFDMLLTWSRRETYTLGFGPFPIIFSINLFLWFKPDWFYLQFLMVAVGFTVKEFVRWNKEGRRVHIFNPSSFPLGLFAVILFVTDTTHLTWGREIATTQLFPPHIYILIFLISLPAQFLFGVASMTLSAVVTAYTFALVYFTVTGTYFFLVPSVPIAVFLGMHLLFNDPSTSPRTELGRVMFGVLYGLSVIGLFALLGRAGAPTFYDKLLAVPILNLMIQGIDWAARSKALNRFDPAVLGRSLTPRRRNVAYISVWAVVFGLMQFQTDTQVALARGDALLSQGQLGEAIAAVSRARANGAGVCSELQRPRVRAADDGPGPGGCGAATTRVGSAARQRGSSQQPGVCVHSGGPVAGGGGAATTGSGAAARLFRGALQPCACALRTRAAAPGGSSLPRGAPSPA